MSDRDDANLRQFKSRAQQPKLLRAGAANPSLPEHSVNVFVVFDSDFGGISDQIEATRFKYTGTSPSVSAYEGMCSRRNRQACMQSSFMY